MSNDEFPILETEVLTVTTSGNTIGKNFTVTTFGESHGVALGCVIKGKTPHFEFICKSTFDAILNLSITYNKPIGNGIITALNQKQAAERSGKIKSKYKNKGFEAANAVLSILSNGPKKI